MKPDEAKSDTASKRLADSVRKSNAAEIAAHSIVGTPTSLPALVKLEKSLLASGSLFLGGSRPSLADVVAFDEVSKLIAPAAASSGTPLEALPKTAAWLDLVGLFPADVRASWL